MRERQKQTTLMLHSMHICRRLSYEANDATHDYRIPDFPSHFQAESPFSSLQSAKEKSTVLQIYVKFARHRRHYQTKRGKNNVV